MSLTTAQDMAARVTHASPQRVLPASGPLKRRASNVDYDAVDPHRELKKRVLEPSNAISVQKDENLKIVLPTVAPLDTEARRRNQFYLNYQAQFAALLPEGSQFFANLQRRMAGDTGRVIPKEAIQEQPSLITGGTMKDYQLDGLSHLVWLHRNFANGILGDEMGLGKTLQTLSLFAYIKEHEPASIYPHLIVCPLSVMATWAEEAARWFPTFRVARFHAVGDRKELKRGLVPGTYDLLVTTYEGVASDHTWLKSRKWNYIVLDEGHRIKNSETQASSKLLRWGAQHRLILSGTPVQNQLKELWGLLRWLHPNVFTEATQSKFSDAFNLSTGSFNKDMIEGSHALLQVIMLRREKAVADQSVPEKEEKTVFLPLSDLQRRCYYVLLKGMDVKVDFEEGDMSSALASLHHVTTHKLRQTPGRWKKLQNLLIQLRRLCDHPYVLPELEPEEIGEHLVLASSKFAFIDKLLKEVLPKGERVLIFSQWTEVLGMMEDFCRWRKIKYALLDGSTSRARRSLNIRLFQEENSGYQVFLVSTKAGGQGITLTQANHCVLLDSSWNPHDDLQAIGRAHRVGQKKKVTVYRLICAESVEDQMLERLRKKLYLAAKLNESLPDDDAAPRKPQENDLLSILLFGSAAVRDSTGNQQAPAAYSRFINATLDEILAESQQTWELRTGRLKHQIGEAVSGDLAELVKDEEQRLLQGVTQVQTRLFEGQLHQRVDDLETLHDIGQQEHEATRAESKTMQSHNVKRESHEHEDWCIACRGLRGGEAQCCLHCPRIYHLQCVESGTKKRGIQQTCPQHKCRDCDKGTQEAGGLLYRCRTCPSAFCEACLPARHEWEPVGDEIPEFQVLGFESPDSVFYIHCLECLETFRERPEIKADWEEEWAAANSRLRG